MQNAKYKVTNAKSRVRLFILHFALNIPHFAFTTAVLAAEPPAVTSPLSPRESLQHIVLQDGLKVELVASEPNVIAPVAVRFDEDGRMWVVEMRDYPMTEVTGENSHSVVKVLDDHDGDGYYETVAVVADDLRYATGLQPWKGGAIVTQAGKVSYLKDTTGDDKADINETWYKGFSEGNQQLRANHPRLALDNHIYIAGGLRGGTIIDARRPDSKPVSISGMDFRFDPLSGKYEAVSGLGQFGLTFDDYGNRFNCSNRNPAMHVVLEDDELKMNPLVAVPSVIHDVAKAGEASRVFPIARSWTTSNLHAGQFTAACGVEIYRGDALPAEFRGNLFVCEPTGHLVHRETVRPKGVTFESTPAYDGVEFLASRDSWFHPVNLEVGPDGALYVVDMYRAVVEHPDWMPEELKRRPDLMDGRDRGRIYRVVPRHFKRPAAPKLADAPSDELVEYLTDANAWWRETASRLLLERQDKTALPKLLETAKASGSPIGQIHALWLLNGLGIEFSHDLSKYSDRPRVLEQIIHIQEARSENKNGDSDLRRLADHADPRVRFRALLAMKTDAALIPRRPADEWEMNARLIRAGRRAGELFEDVAGLTQNAMNPRRFVSEAARMAVDSENKEQIHHAVTGLLSVQGSGKEEVGRIGLASLLAAATRRGMPFVDVRATVPDGLHAKLDGMVDDARRDADDLKMPVGERCDAINLVAAAGGDADMLTHLALDDPQQAIRLRAIAALTKRGETEPWHALVGNFSRESPALQRAILSGLFVGPERLNLLLDSVENGDVKPTEIDVAHSKQLLSHTDPVIKMRAEALLATAIPADREKMLAEYQAVLEMNSSSAQGRAVFEKNCAVCHRVDNLGVDVAPDISDSRERLPAQLLADIIQPNRAIDSNYFSYTVVTTDGLSHTGVLTAETSTSVTLKQQEGKSITIPRSEIEELRSDGISFMPDGLEKNIPPQDMADLISFIKNWRYLNEEPAGGQ
jgi:putative membrane-bound dehydrogenase-like protein